MKCIARTAEALLLVLMLASVSHADGWRTDGTGRYPGATPVAEWDAGTNVLWQVPTKAWGNATPVIAEDRLFIAAERMTLLCVGTDGKMLWEKAHDPTASVAADVKKRIAAYQKLQGSIRRFEHKIRRKRDVEKSEAGLAEAKKRLASLDSEGTVAAEVKKFALPRTHPVTGYSSATPVTDGTSVIMVFGDGQVVAYTLAGELRWTVKVNPPKHMWGHCASPLIVGDRVIVHVGDAVTALALADGRPLWMAASGM
ncbi:MAG: outer membrane protein assembly factor BamB family protein [Planctomycetota bacterium]|jgi:outer membrane protein assembly factor BamB